MTAIRITAALVLVALLLAIEARAQSAPAAGQRPVSASTRAPQPPARLGVRGVASAGLLTMSARDSFEAITGSASMSQFGGGVQVVNLWRGLFVELTIERSRSDGQRAFVLSGEVFPLGIPVEVSATPLDVTAGWRFVNRSRLTPYAGGGVTSVQYREESPFADAGDDVDERYAGYVVMGGAEVRALRWLHLRGELRYRSVPDALGAGGVSAVFDESNLGGAAFAFKVAIGR